MLKNIKLFANHTAYEAAKDNIDKPNVVMCQQEDEVHYNPTPQPIAPIGKVQVFANPQCTEYATGYCKDVWVRLNQGFGFNETLMWGNVSEEATYLGVITPTTAIPNDHYAISCWVDWCNEEDYVEPFTSGQIVKCSYVYGEPILDNVQVIFE